MKLLIAKNSTREAYSLGADARLAANDEAEPVVHTIARTREGFGLDAKVTLRCACGWSFSADEADDYAYSRLKQQEAHHAKGGAL